MNLRSLNNEEFALANRVDSLDRSLLKYAQVEYREQGNFTICLVSGFGGYGIGVTKRSVQDTNRPEHATRIAFRRSLENYAQSLPEKTLSPQVLERERIVR